jgi:CIC family chloride channel protein
MRVLAGGVLLSLVTLVHNPGHLPGSLITEHALWGHGGVQETGLLIATQVLILAAVVSGFGSIGLFWPTLAIGCLSGYEIHALWSGHAGGSPLAIALTLIGGTSVWSAVFGTPLAAAVAAFEFGRNPDVLIPCYAGGLVALRIRRWLKTPALFDKDLEARGLALLDGKSLKVMESLYVRDAMVTDHETVHEQEAVTDLYSKILNSRYPFLPVVNSRGEYVGLLTIDMVQEAYEAAGASKGAGERVSLGKLLEAKDILYRTRGSIPVVRSTERLSATAGMFDGTPSVPVVGEDGRVIGLLFAYMVRVAYDREVARRSLAFEILP